MIDILDRYEAEYKKNHGNFDEIKDLGAKVGLITAIGIHNKAEGRKITITPKKGTLDGYEVRYGKKSKVVVKN